MKMKLKEFIDMIKEFEDDNYDIVSSKNDEAAKLAKLMNDLKDKSKKERQEYLKDVKDKASSFFINYLIERDYEKKYVFLQDETVDFEYELFNPYINPDKKEYSQKWHVMVSLLALLDVVNHAKEYKGKKYGVQGEIDYIDFDEKKITMKGTGGRPVTYSAPWASWVYKAKRESETKKNQ